MTGSRAAALFAAVVAGDYALLMLVNGQLTEFGVAGAICAGSAAAVGLIDYTARQERNRGARRRAVIWAPPDRQAATAGTQCTSCGEACEKASESPSFVDRQGTRLCVGCAAALNPEPTR
ncbi:hypothetical protein [Mycobacterium asiaticum]|uniref:Uncharacterized protein n=1 Tax=Mycobacterium asiaticum TaxID=1790 RepID=A0A1A3MX07_MYCAS|nr:hypothetical protein [Mycobacterium asiaticum]OBK13615.1 hypothetical protein A5636_01215 [Mycobacterium asiaticum]